MTAKQSAIQDIMSDLEKQGKCFIAFHSELNPIMQSLVHNQLDAQRLFGPKPNKANYQLIATCLYCKDTNTAKLDNYTHYYEKTLHK